MKLAIVTGAAGGLGTELCAKMKAAGWDVLPLTRRDWDMTEHPSKALAMVRQYSPENPERVVLIHNAAYLPISKASEATERDVEVAVRVNLTAPILLTQEVLKIFPKAEIGFITSGSIDAPYSHWSLYIAGKAGLRAFLRTLKLEGVTVHELDPGLVDTPMQQKIRASNSPDARRFDGYFRFGKLQKPDAAAERIVSQIA